MCWLNVGRTSYTRPITITQVIHAPDGGTRTRQLPRAVLAGFNGLRQFFWMRVVNARGKTIFARRMLFCPDGFDPQRASPDSPPTSLYPLQCGSLLSLPFQLGTVWGMAKGWAVDPVEGLGPGGGGPPVALMPGTYKVTESITPEYRRLFNISARAATATVTVRVVQGTGGPALQPSHRQHLRTGRQASAPTVPTLVHPPRAVLPDLVALPAWQISVSHPRHATGDFLDFAATVWIGGNGPLDVQGFRIPDSPVMKAYQYFWRNGQIIGRVRAGTMGFDNQKGHHHWHFEQFARYALLNSAKSLAVRSHKAGFCITPTDPVNLLLPHAVWQPKFLGFGVFTCGQPTALWVREDLPVGWGDTYIQSVAGNSFNITHIPNGTYYIEVIANPDKILHETTTRNDISLRKIIIGGTLGHRTVKVPAWHGLDPGGR